MTLPLDVARCDGATVNNDKYGEPMPPCRHCERRLQIPKNHKVRYMLIAPPKFDKGTCDKQITKEVANEN